MRKPLESHAMLSPRRKSFFEGDGVEIEPRTKPAKKRYRDCSRALAKAREDAKARVHRRGDENAWSDATAASLVGLYAEFHAEFYKVEAIELSEEFLPARSAADKCARILGGIEEAVAMLRWKWSREKKRIRSGDAGEFRIGWRFMFSKKMITDYRIAMERMR